MQVGYFLLVGVLVAILLLVEIVSKRVYFRDLKKLLLENPKINLFFLYNQYVQKIPNTVLKFRFYGPNAELYCKADVRLNNLGLMSKFDYDLETPKREGEIRILVIGGEQTASSVVDHSWPDYLQEELGRRIKGKDIKVFNFGWPDAGPEHYIEYWKEWSEKVDPDLTIVNFVESDFYRKIQGAPLRFKGKEIKGYVELRYLVDGEVAKTTAPYAEGYVPPPVPAGEGIPVIDSFYDFNIIPARPYGFFVSDKFMGSKHYIEELQKRVVRDMVDGAVDQMEKPTFGRYFLGLRRLRRGNVVSDLRNFDETKSMPINKEDLVDFGVRTFGWLPRNIPNLMLIHNFNYFQVNQPFELTEMMKERDPKIEVIDMRKYIPEPYQDIEKLKTLYIPQMAEKWNEDGMAVFAAMVAGVVEERLRSNQPPPSL